MKPRVSLKQEHIDPDTGKFKKDKPRAVAKCKARQPPPPTLDIDAVVVNTVPRRLAQSRARPGLHYAAVCHNGGRVTVRATTGPNNDNTEHAQVQWTVNGQGQPNGCDVGVPLDNVGEFVVNATYQHQQASLSVWVIWAQLQIIDNGNVPAGCNLDFSNVPHGITQNPQQLGIIHGQVQNLPQAAGRICVQATLQPAGVHDVIQSRLRIFRRIVLEHTFQDGQVAVRQNVDDTSAAEMVQLQPNANDEIFDLDAPNIAYFHGTDYAAETYINFRQHVEFDGHVCSNVADWQFYGEFFSHDPGNLQANPQPAQQLHVWTQGQVLPANAAVIRVHVGPGHMAIPQQARFRLRRVGQPVTDEYIDNHGEQV